MTSAPKRLRAEDCPHWDYENPDPECECVYYVCCDKVRTYGDGHGHSPDCDNYDGPGDGDAWSGGFCDNH